MIRQFFKDRLDNPKNAVVEILILIGAAYNFAVTAEWQGFSSPNLTVKYGAIVWALLIDGGYFTCLFMMRDSLYKGQQARYTKWKWGAVFFGIITFQNSLLFNAVTWHPSSVPAGSLGVLGVVLEFLVESGFELLLKAGVPIAALYALALIPPIRRQTLEEVQEETKIEVAREEGKNQLEALRSARKRNPKQERREAEQRLMIRLRSELVRAEVRHVERLSDTQVKVKAAALKIYDPLTDEVTEYQPKPVPPFKQVLEIALLHQLVTEEEQEEAKYMRGNALADWHQEVRQRVEEAGLTPEVAADTLRVEAISAEDDTPASETAPLGQRGVIEEALLEEDTHGQPMPMEAPPVAPNIPRQRRYHIADIVRYTGLPRSTVVNRCKRDYAGPRDKKINANVRGQQQPWIDYDELLRIIPLAQQELAEKAKASARGQQNGNVPAEAESAHPAEQELSLVEAASSGENTQN